MGRAAPRRIRRSSSASGPIRLDQPQVMGILNVTPDSFSDGGKFLDDPEEARRACRGDARGGRGDHRHRRRKHAARRRRGVGRRRDQARGPGGRALRGDGRGGQHRHPPAGGDGSGARGRRAYDQRRLGAAPRSAQPRVRGRERRAGGADARAGRGATTSTRAATTATSCSTCSTGCARARDRAIAGGIARERIVLDPGIGFGKSHGRKPRADERAAAVPRARPAAAARRQPQADDRRAEQRGAGAQAARRQRWRWRWRAMDAGVQLLRVHDVAETVQARNVWRGLRDAALTDFCGLAD